MNGERIIMRLLFNLIQALTILCISCFGVYVSIVGDHDLWHKYSKFTVLILAILIVNAILGWIYWKIKGRPNRSYDAWFNQGSGRIINIVSIVIFVLSLLFSRR